MSLIMAVYRPNGSYAIAVDPVDIGGGQFAADVISWRQARRVLDPVAYAHLARTSFADWCKRNGYQEEATG